MILSKSVAELQREHVGLELECIDRMYLNAYVPQLHRLALKLIFVPFLNFLFFHGLSYFTLSFRVRQIGGGAVGETSARRGHRYVTNVLDCDGAGLLLMVEGRSSEALGSFA